MAIKFETMTEETRRQIWADMFENMRDLQQRQLEDLKKLVKSDWAKLDLNGRQIRNVVWNARILADKKGCDLKVSIDEVLDDTKLFLKQIDNAKKDEERKLLGDWGPV